MASVNLAPVINGTSVLGTTGLPLAGGLIYTFQAGSSTALTTYTDNSGLVANTNPIVLGTDGRPPNEIWLQSGFSYKFQIENSLGTIISTLDNLYGIPQSSSGGGSTSVPSGCILLWSGSSGSIPAGFQLCDGTNGTPDLRDKFIVGAGNAYAVSQTGGSADSILPSHTHTATSTVTDPGHAHLQKDTAGSPGVGNISTNGGTDVTSVSSGTVSTATASTSITVATTNTTVGVSPTGGNLPPYYALCYIYKS